MKQKQQGKMVKCKTGPSTVKGMPPKEAKVPQRKALSMKGLGYK